MQLYKSEGEGDGTPLQSSRLENPMDGGAWWAAVHGVAQSWTQLSDFTFTFMHWRRKWQPTPVFLPGESQGRGSLVGCLSVDNSGASVWVRITVHKGERGFFMSPVEGRPELV